MAPSDLSIRPELVPVLSKYHTSHSDIPSSPDEILKVVQVWASSFVAALTSGHPDKVLELLVPDVPLWRDLITLSWDFRTLTGVDAIKTFLSQHLPNAGITNVEVSKNTLPMRMQRDDRLGWINAFLTFTSSKGLGTIVARLVPTRASAGDGDIKWLAHGILMDLDGLKDHPPLLGELRKQEPVFGTWEEDLAKYSKFEEREPSVVIIGGSQSGLAIAARLKVLGVDALVVERHPRIGDSWRNRYDALCLHDPVWYDHMPYLPFPPTWPVYTPAKKLANWLETYASILELPVWTSANVLSVTRSSGDSTQWTVEVERPEGKRSLKPKHVVFAIGWGAGHPSIPKYDGLQDFKGEVLHSAVHKTAKDHIGKKVVVIGASTSGHDVCADLAKHGVDVTMVQRSPTHIMSNASIRRAIALYAEDGPPTDIADRLTASLQTPLAITLSTGVVEENKANDKELLDALAARGFQHYDGPSGTGFVGLLYQRGGGYYFDTGACGYIIDGAIKLHPGKIKCFTDKGLEFDDGTNEPADVVIWATGYESASDGIKRLVPQEDVKREMKPAWELNEEGELGGLWQNSGVRGLYIHMGNLAAGRYFSKHLSLRIKAIEEGLLQE